MAESREYAKPRIDDRTAVGDPLIIGYPSPRWESANPSAEDGRD